MVVAALSSSLAGAQSLSSNEMKIYQGNVEERADAAVEPAGTFGASPGTHSKFVLEASSEKTTASFRVGKRWVTVSPRADDGDDIRDRTSHLSLSATTPFDGENDKRKDLGDLSGLTAGTSTRLEGGFTWWPRAPKGTVWRLDEVCNDAVRDLFVSTPGVQYSFAWREGSPVPTPQRAALLFEDAEVDCAGMLQTDAGLKAAADKVNATNQAKAKEDNSFKVPPKVKVAADTSRRDEFWSLLLGRVREARGASHGGTLSIAGNRQEFAYASMAAPSVITEDVKEGYGLTLGYNLVLDTSVLSVTASYEETYKGAKEQEICNPIGTTGSLTCADAALSKPSNKENEILAVEYRVILNRSFPVALGPRVQFSVEDSEFGVRLPIYFAPDPKRAIDGGLALTWSEEDETSVSVFVGKAFKFFD